MRVTYERTLGGLTERWECEAETVGEATDGFRRLMADQRRQEFEDTFGSLQQQPRAES